MLEKEDAGLLGVGQCQTNEVSSAGLKPALETPEPAAAGNWNWHAQNTDIVQYHPGAVRLLAYLNSAHMGSYQTAVDNAARTGLPADIEATRAYRYKYGFGLNLEQEIVRNVGAFARLG